MRKKYHITINRDDRHQLENVAAGFGRKIEYIGSDGDSKSTTRHYFVDFSKYEFLYARLSCKIIAAVEVPEEDNTEQQQQQQFA